MQTPSPADARDAGLDSEFRRGLGLYDATMVVVGSMIGAGVFLLPRRFGTETGVLGALIAWTLAGFGMLMLAFVFQRLAMRKPDLDAGVFDVLGVQKSLAAFASYGSTAPGEVQKQVERWRKKLERKPE